MDCPAYCTEMGDSHLLAPLPMTNFELLIKELWHQPATETFFKSRHFSKSFEISLHLTCHNRPWQLGPRDKLLRAHILRLPWNFYQHTRVTTGYNQCRYSKHLMEQSSLNRSTGPLWITFPLPRDKDEPEDLNKQIRCNRSLSIVHYRGLHIGTLSCFWSCGTTFSFQTAFCTNLFYTYNCFNFLLLLF